MWTVCISGPRSICNSVTIDCGVTKRVLVCIPWCYIIACSLSTHSHASVSHALECRVPLYNVSVSADGTIFYQSNHYHINITTSCLFQLPGINQYFVRCFSFTCECMLSHVKLHNFCEACPSLYLFMLIVQLLPISDYLIASLRLWTTLIDARMFLSIDVIITEMIKNA